MTDGVRSDEPTYLHLIRGADTYLYSIIFCLVEIFCRKIFFWLISHESAKAAKEPDFAISLLKIDYNRY